MGNLLSLGYLTSRKDPKIEWFFRSLKREFRGDYTGLQLIIVDFHAEEEGRKEFMVNMAASCMGAAANPDWFVHVTPKPTVWQGKHKKTRDHHFAASNARNTVFAHAKNDFVACVDDLSVLLPGWIDNAMHASHHGYVALGAYKKVMELDVDYDGNISCKEHASGIDSRWNLGRASGIVEAEGTWMFGCSFALPIEFVLKVNGFDEICDGTGFEDVEFGCRLQRSGCKFFYNRNMCTYESEEGHSWEGNTKFVRQSKMTTCGLMSDWWIKNNRIDSKETWTCGNKFDLRQLRESVLKGEAFPIPEEPTHDWRDGKPLGEI